MRIAIAMLLILTLGNCGGQTCEGERYVYRCDNGTCACKFVPP